jgi:phosphoribosylaminoimidazole-succinocarboxamide synthase
MTLEQACVYVSGVDKLSVVDRVLVASLRAKGKPLDFPSNQAPSPWFESLQRECVVNHHDGTPQGVRAV